jgi:predicted DNA-binding antitoxin AbrB/MazE fold protein
MSCHLIGPSPSRVYTLLAYARYNHFMVRHVDAIFSQGAFRPLEPLALPEGTRVHLSVEEKIIASDALPAAKILTPKLAHPEDAADFVMEVREAGDAGV